MLKSHCLTLDYALLVFSLHCAGINSSHSYWSTLHEFHLLYWPFGYNASFCSMSCLTLCTSLKKTKKMWPHSFVLSHQFIGIAGHTTPVIRFHQVVMQCWASAARTDNTTFLTIQWKFIYYGWIMWRKDCLKKKNQHVPEKTRETAASLETEAVAWSSLHCG